MKHASKICSTLRAKLPIVLVVLVIALLGVSGLILSRHNTKAEEVKRNAVITYSPDVPDENKPDKASYKWYGQPNDPKYIAMPSIGAEGFLQKVGVDQHKQVATPGNIFMAGWFVDTVRPGQQGLSIIDGHVNGIENAGIFKNLLKLKKGDAYSVEFGNGDKVDFKVKEVKEVPTAEAASILFSQDPEVTNQLNLITCGGKYDQKTRQYQNRVIVVSEKI